MTIIEGEFSEAAWQAFQQTVVHGKTSQEAAAELGMTAGGRPTGKNTASCDEFEKNLVTNEPAVPDPTNSCDNPAFYLVLCDCMHHAKL